MLAIKSSSNQESIFLYSLSAIVLLVPLILYIQSPTLIRLTKKKLEIHFPLKKTTFDVSNINEIKRVEFVIPMTFGSKGIFGFIGKSNGDIKTYVKNPSQVINIKLPDQEILISCDDPDSLILNIQNLKQ
jgi:hypothetical protein